MSKPFQFKQFTVAQDRCAMKVGTDGVLLGAWVSLDSDPVTVLDIGAGTGLIALMLAQRSTAESIEAIEIDDAAYQQCVDNFEDSPWADRLFCYHAGLDEMVAEIDEPYDLIVSNPPFYTAEVSSGDTARDRARHNSALPFKELLESVARLLDAQGSFAVIIPYQEQEYFMQIAQGLGLYPNRITNVRGNASAPFKRSLLQFSFQRTIPRITALAIEIQRHQYTAAYQELVSAFYLKM